MEQIEPIDESQGWCCDGRTHQEHTAEEGHCCQQPGRRVEDLPDEGRALARTRFAQREAGT